MSQVSDNFTITSTLSRKALQLAFKVKRPVFVWGPPGIGKSEVVAGLTEEMGGLMIDLRMAQMEPTDIRGIPFYNKEKNVMEFAPPVDLPDEETASKYPIVVLFLDEMNSAAPAVQAAGYQLVLNRCIGKYKLPDNVVIVAAGNRESDKGVTYRMPMPLANRFVHLEMRADFDSWQHWAVTHKINEEVVGYLMRNKQELYEFDSKSSSRAFATPRSWTFVSDLLNHETTEDSDTIYALIAGSVGEGLAAKFSTHRKFVAQLPDPSDILSGKVKDLSVKEVSAMYSLTVSMCYELKDLMETKKVDRATLNGMMDNFLTYMMANFETELVIMGAKTAIKTYGLPMEPSKLKCFDDFHKRFGKYILEAVK